MNRPGSAWQAARLSALLAAWLCAWTAAPTLAAATSEDALQRRLDSLDLTRQGEAGAIREIRYEELRDSKLLIRPVHYRGRLSFDPANGILTQWVDEPRNARLAITPTHLEMQLGGGATRRLALSQRPELATLLAGLRALLSADRSALEAHFLADYQEDEQQDWVLLLRPRDALVAEQLVSLEVRGRGSLVKRLNTSFTSGERRRMTLLPPGPETNDGD
jgi:hypothetical protein